MEGEIMKWSIIMALGLLALGITVLALPALVLGSQELTVSAAASLTNAFPEIGQRFEQQLPGTKVIFNFAASGPLLQQIAQGAPVDVFASADQKTMNQAQERGFIVPASRKNFVSNALVLIVPQGSKLTLSGLQDLAPAAVKRVALGNPATVPAGRYTQDALTKAGLWDGLQPKLIMGESVRQVLDYVSRGEVDAGFVFATDAAIAKGKVKTVTEAQGHQPIVYPVAIVSASPKKELAQEFLNFLFTPEGMEILKKYGFGQP
jgi:molybdate transport system substrate-binding protein